ncbi:MAG: Xaa-Pro peptidase family protein [Clostridiales bacterium]|nr:Xaa-Pro peptidase family protein [Clostridiales bacterium]
MNHDRVERILEKLREKGLGQMILTDPSSIFYITGKMFVPGSRFLGLYISDKENHKLFVNRLFPVDGLDVDICHFSDMDDVVQLMADCTDHHQALGIDRKMTAEYLLGLQQRGAGTDYINSSECVNQIRGQKDKEEQRLMMAVSDINDRAMEIFKGLIKEGVTEMEVARQIEPIYRSLGADGNSFQPIIAFGANAADPHHKPGDKSLKPGECVLFDVGCRKDYYCADMTRTFFYKHVDDEAEKVYNLVLQANLAGENAIRPGVRFCDVDRAARSVIEEAGFGPCFTHRLGHSIGIDVHEPGDANTINMDKLVSGNIFSCEPGVYLKDRVGVRIEDLCLVTDSGVQVLNHYSKALEILE